MSRATTPTPAWLAPARLLPDLAAGLWLLLIVLLYADGPWRSAWATLQGLLER